ncbi:MAG: DUF3078 domain-containing protein [Ferruginibacter sp.]|nr:DUF3078 domain-containing protein [Cytophagales bacterium]
MKKTLPILAVFWLSAAGAVAQGDTTYWRKSFSAGANLNQAAFSDNWKAGGVNSVALGLFANGKADYRRDRSSWDNEMQLQYGLIKNAGQGMRKSLDRILLDSKYGYKIGPHWDAFSSVNFLSQFARGYEYDVDGTVGNNRLISNFMSPGFLTFALGFEYKPVAWFSLRLSPFAPRFTFLADQAVRPTPAEVVYGVPPGRTVRREWLAAQVQAQLDKDIAENVNLKLRYLAYGNYETLALNTIDHRVDAILTAKVNRFVSVSLTGTLLYDRDQDLSVQYSQALALGILYNVQNFTDQK